MTNVLPAAFIVLATYALIALGKSIIPGFGTLPNNAIRAIGYVICYAMAAVNLMVQQAVHWQDLWGLLPIAGALFSTSALLYHIGADGPTAAAPPAPRQPVPDVPAHVDLSLPVSDPRQPAWLAALVQEAPPARAGTAQPAVGTVPPEPPEKQTPTEAPVGPTSTVTYTSGPPTP